MYSIVSWFKPLFERERERERERLEENKGLKKFREIVELVLINTAAAKTLSESHLLSKS